MSDDEPLRASSLGHSPSFEKSSSRRKSAAFVKRSTDNTQLEQNFQTSKLAKERAIANDQMLQECSFAPSIKGLPKSYGPNKTAGTLVYNRLTKWEKTREVDMTQKKLQRAHEEVKNCTFKPQINKQRNRKTSEKHATTRLYEESAMIASNKARIAEELRAKEIEKQTEECTFRPRLSTRRTAWAGVEPKYNQPPEVVEKPDDEKENYSFTPHVNDVAPEMVSASLYVNMDVTDRLTRTAKSSPHQKPKPSKERTIIDMASFLSGSATMDVAATSVEEEDFTEPGDPGPSQPALSAAERDQRQRNFQSFLTRQNAAQERKKIQVQELEKSLFPPPRFEVNEESRKIIRKSQKGEFMERLQHDVELRNDRRREKPLRTEEYPFKPTLNKSRPGVQMGAPPSDASSQHMKPARKSAHQSTGTGERPPAAPSTSTQKKKPALLPSSESFTPQFSTSSFRAKARPPSNPDVYIQQHERMLEKRKELQEKVRIDKEEMELEGCTFAPQIKDCPKFVTNIAKSISVVKSVRATSHIPPPSEEWR